jgi:nucleotide-binding universal stress UspA family protein
MTDERGVVIGYDGSEPSRDALAWGLAEAATRGLPATLVHAVVPPVPTSALGYAVPVDLDLVDRLQEGAGEVLRDAASQAGAAHPDVDVRTEVAIGNPSSVLIEASRTADLVVLGSRGHGGFRGLLLGSVGVQVASHAVCPAVVVRGAAPAGATDVVVGVDGSPLSRAALRFGYDYASRHGLRLVALHAWEPPAYDLLAAPVGPPPVSLADISDDELRVTAEAMAGFGADYPDVTVEERLVQAPAPRALVEAGDAAALLVLGSHGRGEFLGALLGSASQAVLHRATGPVAVVHG